MTVLESKVDALVRFILAENSSLQAAALSDLKDLAAGKVPTNSVDEEIEAFLMELGMPGCPKGYRQLFVTLELAVEEPKLLEDLSKGLFPRAAEQCGGASWKRIERNIRHCIEVAWDQADYTVLNRYFGNTISAYTGRPSTGAFLARATREIRRRLGR